MRPLSVLYVEDCVELQEAIADLLRDDGDEVVCCSTAEQAQAVLARRAFDVMLVDVRLDGRLSGIELSRRALAKTPAQWLILCSGVSIDPTLLALGPNLRALTKPFEFSELESLLEQVRNSNGVEVADGALRPDEMRILVVDDSRDAAEMLASALTAEGFRTRASYSGQDALVAAGIFRPHAVLIDVGMPVMDGCELAVLLRERHGDDMVLIAFTGRDRNDRKVLETINHVDHHFQKPVDMMALRRVLSMSCALTNAKTAM